MLFECYKHLHGSFLSTFSCNHNDKFYTHDEPPTQAVYIIFLKMYYKRDICARSRQIQKKYSAELNVWIYELNNQ